MHWCWLYYYQNYQIIQTRERAGGAVLSLVARCAPFVPLRGLELKLVTPIHLELRYPAGWSSRLPSPGATVQVGGVHTRRRRYQHHSRSGSSNNRKQTGYRLQRYGPAVPTPNATSATRRTQRRTLFSSSSFLHLQWVPGLLPISAPAGGGSQNGQS